MFRKTLLSTMAAIVLAASAITASTTASFASDFGREVAPVSGHRAKPVGARPGFDKPGFSRQGKHVAAGVALGAAALVLGAIVHAKRGEDRREDRRDERGQRRGHAVSSVDGGECFDKPIRRFDPEWGEMVVVAYRTVCR